MAPLSFITFGFAFGVAWGLAWSGGLGTGAVVALGCLVVAPPIGGIVLGIVAYRAGAELLGLGGIVCNVLAFGALLLLAFS